MSDNGPNGNRWNNEFKERKGSTNEGGVRVPFFIQWPKKIKPGSKSDYPMTFYDYFATVSDILGEAPTNKIDGNSYYPSLMGEKQKMSTHLYWEFPAQGGQQAIRIDHWKGIRTVSYTHLTLPTNREV